MRPVEGIVSALALNFLRNDALVVRAFQLMEVGSYKSSGYSERFPKRTKGLNLSASFGLLCLSEMLVTLGEQDANVEADSKDEYGRTPLSWAVQRGYEALVKLFSNAYSRC